MEPYWFITIRQEEGSRLIGHTAVLYQNTAQPTPLRTGSYASRQTYVGGFSIKQTALLLKERILDYAHELTRMPAFNLDIRAGKIVRTTDGRELMTLGELATEAIYSLSNSQHLTI